MKQYNFSQKYFFTSSLSNHTQIKSSYVGLQQGWMRTTFILKIDHVIKIKKLAKKNKTTIKKLLHVIVASYLKDREIAPIPLKNESLL